MSDEFQCPIVSLSIEKHPNADNLVIVKCDNGKVSIVTKKIFKDGDWAVCIPQHGIVPDDILEELGLTGRLAGSKKNIVKPITLRGIYSDCLLYPLNGKRLEGKVASVPRVGMNMASVLGIKRRVTDHPLIYEGVVASPRNIDKITWGDYDILHLDKWNNENGNYFQGADVFVTEKIHGTWVEFSYHPQHAEIVTSKGYSKKELVFVLDENNKNNLYVNMYYEQRDKVQYLFETLRKEYGLDMDVPLRLMGEIYGPKVQDLRYGVSKPKYIAFDIHIGQRNRQGFFLHTEEFNEMCNRAGIETVPLLYHGGYDDINLSVLGEGFSVLDPETQKEGCVIKTANEGYHYPQGRTVAKYVSPVYLSREKGTEWN